MSVLQKHKQFLMKKHINHSASVLQRPEYLAGSHNVHSINNQLNPFTSFTTSLAWFQSSYF